MMFEITDTLSLVVPLDRQLRNTIRETVDHYAPLQEVFPPVSYNTLDQHADALIRKHNWSKDHKAFVMVCCGNAVWRSVVGTVPYSRRMLLLPQCLKNSTLCKGQFDEFGLLCSECGNCIISELLQEAESMEYLTIVAEGTTIASRLVESGKVDAIIGVGCLDVLQKMFTTVNKYSVPAIGVPLLTCGCKDTTADTDWIRKEMHFTRPQSSFQLLNLNELKNKITALFIEKQIRTLLNASGSATDQLVLETLLAGGKRIRPLLTALTYEAFSNQPDTDTLHHLALSIECFHKASLIHDDIEDNDSSRYGKETLHTQYGTPVAINIGDLLIGEGYRLIAESNLPSRVSHECLKIVSRGHKALSVGQGNELMARVHDEILSLQQVLTIFENKTASAFRVSLLLGAVAGGADQESINLLDRFSHLIGLSYQIQDDLEDFLSEDECTPFENPSILISMLSEKIGMEDKSRMINALSQNKACDLKALIDQYRIREDTVDLLKKTLNELHSCLNEFHNRGLKLALHEIVGKTFSDYL